MNAILWNKSLASLNDDTRQQNRHVLLLCDNARQHTHDPAAYSNIRIELLAPNMTAFLQPLDAGVIAAFKARYRSDFVKLAVRRSDEGVTNIYKITQRQAMELADSAWDSISSETIAHRWRHTGICPDGFLTTETLLIDAIPLASKDPEQIRIRLLKEIGLPTDRMDPTVHPNVYRMIDDLSQSPPTEEHLENDQLLEEACSGMAGSVTDTT